MNKFPMVTVLMPVYNGERFLKEAMDSILKQSYADFEFLIIYNNSTDNTLAILESYVDDRIRIIYNQEPKSLAESLNQGIRLAQGKYIARMDCDDISLSNRLESQVAFMEKYSDCAVLGMWANVIDSHNIFSRSIRNIPTNSVDIKSSLIFKCPFVHPTIMFRQKILIDNDLFYDVGYRHDAEDYRLWVKISKHFKLHNLKKIGLKYRKHGENVSTKNSAVIHKNSRAIKLLALQQLNLNITEDLDLRESLIDILNLDVPITLEALKLLDSLLREIKQKKLMSKKWRNFYFWRYCCFAANSGLTCFVKFINSEYFLFHPRALFLLILCIFRKKY